MNRLWIVATCLMALLPGPVLAQTEPTWATPSGIVWTLFPAGDVFPVYVADPHRPGNAIVPRFYVREDIPNTRSPRWCLSAGGRFGILRIDNVPAERSWQVGIEAGLDALFDMQNKNDLIGMDGNYGLTVTTASDGPWAFKIAVLHTSAHLGDEYAQRTATDRINYTREELALATGWRFHPRWRLYGEAGVGYVLRSDDQKPWRLQWGLEYTSAPRVWGGRFAWYSAADFASWDERGWRVDTTVQGGIVARSNGRTYRLLLEYVDGRPPIAEFFKNTEASLALGFRIDL
jgi:uncharacterized protein DUF1207